MVGQRTKNERTHFYSYFRYYNWDVCNVYDMWGGQMDDIGTITIKFTETELICLNNMIETHFGKLGGNKVTKLETQLYKELNEMQQRIKDERHKASIDRQIDPKKEYIEKITG